MDFSENLTQLFKYEPQSSHFNKSQYLLHCTAKYKNLYRIGIMYNVKDKLSAE